jgi:hypothetical protein
MKNDEIFINMTYQKLFGEINSVFYSTKLIDGDLNLILTLSV